MKPDLMDIRLAGFALLLVVQMAGAADAPRVAKTVPANGDLFVNPNLRELRIEFDRSMDTRGGFSIVGGGSTFPKIDGRPRWGSDRVLVTPIELKPDHGYWLSVNSSRFQNFKSANGKPAVPYPVEFKTSGSGVEMKEKPLSGTVNRRSIQQLRDAIANNYSYRDLRGVDWNRQFTTFEGRLIEAKSRAAFAQFCSEMLRPAKDIHIWITHDGQTIGTHQRKTGANLDFHWLQKNVPNWRRINRAVYVGKYPGGVNYLLVGTWNRNRAKELEAAYKFVGGLASGEKLILDLRANSGGDERLARKLAGQFVSKPVVYAKNRNRDPKVQGGYSEVFERVLQPAHEQNRFAGKTAVLMGPANMSSCEAFLLMMRQVPNCQLIGAKSYGASGNPKPVMLANGVEVYLPSWQAMDSAGNLIEGEGIIPDLEVKWLENGRDPVLEAALKALEN